MKYGFFTTLSEPENRRSYHQIIDDLREQAVFCDQAGFETLWLAEHHFGPEGMGNSANPVLLASDLGNRGTLSSPAYWVDLAPYALFLVFVASRWPSDAGLESAVAEVLGS